jgi:hypothetical protein
MNISVTEVLAIIDACRNSGDCSIRVVRDYNNIFQHYEVIFDDKSMYIVIFDTRGNFYASPAE